jgi:hypothetical protein
MMRTIDRADVIRDANRQVSELPSSQRADLDRLFEAAEAEARHISTYVRPGSL